jgi:O-antigen ligase
VEWFRERELARLLFILGALVGGTALLIALSGVSTSRSLWEVTGRLSFDAVNPITYGHVAVTTLLSAVCLWLYRPSAVGRGWLLAGSLISLFVLQQTGSRGPALALVLGLVLVGLYRRRARVLVTLIITLGSAMMILTGSGALDARTRSVEDDPSTLERILVQANALEQFLANPLTGSAYIETTLMMYPHNVFIEAAMATGIVGLLLFVGVSAAVLGCIWRMLREGRLLLPLIAMQYLVASMLSGALYLSNSLWLSMAVVLIYNRPKRYKRNLDNHHLLLMQPRAN